MSSYGVHKGFYIAKDNTIKFAPTQDKDRQLEAIKWLNKLFAEGLIDQEIFTQKRDMYNSKAANDKVGMAYAWPVSGANTPGLTMQRTDPNKTFTPMLPVKGPYGDRFKEDPTSYILPRLFVSRNNKDIATTMKWIDYLFTEEGRMLMTYGIEGKNYNMKDGYPVRVSTDTQKLYAFALPMVQYMKEGTPTNPAMVNDAYTMYTKDLKMIDPVFPNLPLTEEEQSLKAKTESELKTYVGEGLSKLISGVDPITKYDSYVEGFSKIGVDKLRTVYNAEYKKYLANGNK
jgi:putative aldouronate transport system substrate-binding protein